MVVTCPTCKKEYVVLYPDQWVYKKRNNGVGSNYRYYCSWKCLRELDKKGETKYMGVKKLLTEEQEKHAVWLAISGEDPRPYLAECGSKNPQVAWSQIRTVLKETDPETFAKLPRVIGHKKRPNFPMPIPGVPQPHTPTIETPEGVIFNGKKYEPMETPPATAAEAMEGMKDAANQFFGTCEEMGLTLEKAKKDATPVKYDNMTVREIEGVFGRYRRSDVNGITYIDFECEDGLDVLSLTVNQWIQFREEQEKAFAILGVIL